MYEFDKTDIKIVNFLLEDGRMTASEMSRRMGDISERAIRYRIDRMIQEGVIQISAVINPEALGFKIKADVWLEVEADMVLEVAKKMASFDNVTYVACGIGQNDISIQLAAYDTSEIYYFVTEVVRKVPGVRKTTTSIVPIVLKDVYQWRVPERIIKELSESKTVSASK
ncbi:MAG: Lrp/AsnC family transcriptional regulator [Anaerolineales bacterium]|nr:Lrp/AsnC family transcriptional regulator [Anaerolineales bacterium]